MASKPKASGLSRVSLRDFLGTLNVPPLDPLPLVHTTESFRVFDIMREDKLLAMPCSVFREKLCYFFLGRPAYKMKDEANPQYWQMPLAVVVKFDAPPRIKRVLPFDSGAFAGRLLPSHILGFKMANYELAGDYGQISKLVATFFGSNEQYFKRRAISPEDFESRHVLNPLHMEVLALAQMYAQPQTDAFDDRSSTIELQSDVDCPIHSGNLLGLVLPSEYRRATELYEKLKSMDCLLEFYDFYPLRLSHYYHTIYESVRRILKRHGVL